MIFVDSNIPMYLVGASHLHKDDARRLLERFVAERTPLVTDAEVFQEILHRYVAIDRRDAIKPSFVTLLSIVDEVYSIQLSDVERAQDLVLGKRKLSARDAIHVAVMGGNGIKRILSFDSGFDTVSGLKRISE